MAHPTFPTRLLRLREARARFGPLADAMGSALWRMDPIADRAAEALAELGPARAELDLDRVLDGADGPAALVALREAAARFPAWADEDRLAHAGELLFRAGMPGGVVLGAKSLLSGYTSPAGNKPLMMSGGLRANVSRRLAETAKFVGAVAEPGGLTPGREGFRITLRVRLMHAQVRRLIARRDDWRAEDWGAPINQHDMVATILLFAHAWLDGVQALGVHVSDREAEDYVHLWRVAGHVLGVEHELLPATRAEGDRIARFLALTEGPPDDDSRALVRSFFEGPVVAAATERERRLARRRMQAYAGLVRGLLGEEVADQLGLERDRWRFTAPAVREVVRRMERLRRTVPGGRRLAVEAGRRHWAQVVELGLMGRPAEFALPRTLGRFAPGPHPPAVA